MKTFKLMISHLKIIKIFNVFRTMLVVMSFISRDEFYPSVHVNVNPEASN